MSLGSRVIRHHNNTRPTSFSVQQNPMIQPRDFAPSPSVRPPSVPSSRPKKPAIFNTYIRGQRYQPRFFSRYFGASNEFIDTVMLDPGMTYDDFETDLRQLAVLHLPDPDIERAVWDSSQMSMVVTVKKFSWVMWRKVAVTAENWEEVLKLLYKHETRDLKVAYCVQKSQLEEE